MTDALGGRLLGHDPDALPREPIAWDDDVARLRFSTDSPLRSTTGDLEAMALYAGMGCGSITAIRPAAEILDDMMRDATATLSCLAARVG